MGQLDNNLKTYIRFHARSLIKNHTHNNIKYWDNCTISWRGKYARKHLKMTKEKVISPHYKKKTKKPYMLRHILKEKRWGNTVFRD